MITYNDPSIIYNDPSVSYNGETSGGSISQPVWTTPDDLETIVGLTPTLQFNMPESASGDMYFKIEIDTADTFDSLDLRVYQSYPSAAGWEYWDGGAWVPMDVPVDASFVGNEARFTIPVDLDAGIWYRRVTGGVV